MGKRHSIRAGITALGLVTWCITSSCWCLNTMWRQVVSRRQYWQPQHDAYYGDFFVISFLDSKLDRMIMENVITANHNVCDVIAGAGPQTELAGPDRSCTYTGLNCRRKSLIWSTKKNKEVCSRTTELSLKMNGQSIFALVPDLMGGFLIAN